LKKVIFIGGTSYSGSTMLDMILSNDSMAMSLGEVHAILKPFREHHFIERKKLINSQTEWNEILKLKKNFYEKLINTYSIKSIFVDSSKDPNWIVEQSRILSKMNIKCYNVLIYKEPFDIAFSFMKRDKYNLWEKSWVNYHLKYLNLINNFFLISYKSLVTEKETLEKLCNYLEISFSDEKFEFWNSNQTTFFGNESARIHLKSDDKEIDKSEVNINKNFKKIYYTKITDRILIDDVKKRLIKNRKLEILDKFFNENSNTFINNFNQNIYSELKVNFLFKLIRKYKKKIVHIFSNIYFRILNTNFTNEK